MADPLTILMFTNASLGIARSLVHTIKELYELAEAYETAALGIRTVATQCNSFRIAVQRISKWLQTQTEESKHDLDDDFWSALHENLETARMVMDDLDKRIAGLKKTPSKFWTRTKYLWNGVVISELQTQIGGLMSAVSILIQVIDIPTTGGKRSYSLAQRNRLNTITKSVRHNEEQRARIRARQEQNLLDEPIPSNENLAQPDQPDLGMREATRSSSYNQPQTSGPEMQQRTVAQSNRAQSSFSDIAIPDTAPPSYETLDGVNRSTATPSDDKQARKKSSGDEKSKRGFWKNMKMTRPKPTSTSSFGSMFSSSKNAVESKSTSDSTPETLSRTTSETPNLTPQISQKNAAEPDPSISQLHETPAPIRADNDKEYFQLQSAVSGMDITSSDPPASENNSTRPELSPPSVEVHSTQQAQQTNSTLFRQQPQTYNPYAPKLADSSSDSPTPPFTRTRSTYLDEIVPTSQKFERLRPSQRVKDARDDTATATATSTPTATISSTSSTRLGSFTLSSASLLSAGGSSHTQKWSTCPMPSRTVNFTVQFEDESFTNKMSAAAARMLGVDDHVVEYAGIPITSLTMLHSVEDDCVAGDEVEFVVMGEHEQRTPLLVLGAGMAHLRHMMAEGEYVYWDSQPVPEKLRTKERLRLYRRFELVRW